MKTYLEKVRIKEPLVQCITNFVTVNDCANILLASGASPTMAMDIREVEEAVEKVQALVCNMGAIEHTDAMILAGKRANDLGIPVILDPVGAGGTTLRREAVKKLIREVRFSVIRGNASEIKSIAGMSSIGSGVDVSKDDVVSEETLDKDIQIFETLAKSIHTVVAVSGKLDVVTDGQQTVLIRNGCPTMARITGSGCMVTTLIGGFCGAEKEAAYQAVNTALVQRNWLMGYRIAEEELQGENRAEYGASVIKKLAKELTAEYGKGFTKTNLYHFYSFYKAYPEIFHSASGKSLLSWTHYRTLLQVNDKVARDWYEKEALKQTWSVQTLQRNISSQYYYRMLQTQKQELVENEMRELTSVLYH